MKKWILTLVCALLVLTAAMACAEIDYQVIKPAGYDSSSNYYPTVYVLPEDGDGMDESAVANAIKSSSGADMLIVLPELEQGEDLRKKMELVISDVESKYRSIAASSHRAVVGTRVGGYLAYALGLTDASGAYLYHEDPDLFSFVASFGGNFGAENNPWYEVYGNVYDKIAKAPTKDAEGKKIVPFENFFTYMDAPVDDDLSNVKGSTNDLGSLFITFGNGAECHEYTARLGGYDDAFLKESAARMKDRFTTWTVSSLFWITSFDSVVVTQADTQAYVTYGGMHLPGFMSFAPAGADVKIEVTLTDAKTGEKLASASETKNVSGPFGYLYGMLPLANKTGGETANMTLTATVFGTKIELGTAKMVFVKDPVFDGEYQEIDLMDNWYFKYTGYADASCYLDIPALTKSEEYKNWDLVQPALGNWAAGYGNIDETTVGVATSNPYFNFMILGNGYYAREFTLPDAFDTQKPVISVGYVDDRCEVWINGVRVGATGMDANGEPTSDSTWAVFSHFEVDPEVLNYGGKNTIVVRAWNDTSMGAGGWYSGPIGIFSEEAFNAQYGVQANERFYEETFYSNTLGRDNEYLIYLPESYGETDTYYPTMYLLHQFNSDHTSYRTDGIHELMDEAIDEGLIDDMIVVIPNSSEMSWWQGEWEEMVIEDLIPHIESQYRAISDARYRFTAGCSMGGQGAYNVALTNPEHFSGAAAFFGAFDYGDYFGDGVSPVTVARREGSEYMKNFSLGFICGNQDSYGFGRGKIALHQILDSYGVEHYFFIENGGHDGAFYLPYFKDTISNVWSAMNQKNEEMKEGLNLRKMTYASLLTSAQGVVPVFAAEELIDAYYSMLPESSYTDEESPALNIPLRITVTQNGREYRAIVSANNLSRGSDMVVLPELKNEDFVQISRSGSGLDLSKPYSYKIEAIIFDEDWTPLTEVPQEYLDRLKLPDTGDNSSVLLYALLLAASVSMICVLAAKKRRA